MSEAEESIQNGSHTFALAGKFFSKAEWESACQIYHWCRYCDDVTDRGDRNVQFLKNETEKVLSQHCSSEIEAFNSLKKVFQKYQIPNVYAEEMLNGMEMDYFHSPYKTFRELELYCYRVASTVGLMMCYVMGVYDEKALKHASDLGMAMQLTNIARDVKEDLENNRNYFPTEWADQTNFEKVTKLIEKAELYYASGFEGLKYLRLRTSFVILIAALLYREIGHQIILEGPPALKKRVVISLPRKCVLIVEALFITLLSLPQRMRTKSKIVPIEKIWSPV